MQAIYNRQRLVPLEATKPVSCIGPIAVTLPFVNVTARAIIVRQRDGALLATQHHIGAKYALPGGGIEEGETPEDAILRELAEEQIELMGVDQGWRERIAVDYYPRYKELSIWYIFVVDDVHLGNTLENIETKWVQQNQDIWHPYMCEKILLHLKIYVPDLIKMNHTKPNTEVLSRN